MACKKFKPVGELKLDIKYVDKDRMIGFGDEDRVVTGPSVIDLTLGKLFKMLEREFGRCVSKTYVDRKDAPPTEIGWVFNARRRYEDKPKQTYLAEIWVSFFRDAECECCETVAGRMHVTLDEARELLARKESLAA